MFGVRPPADKEIEVYSRGKVVAGILFMIILLLAGGAQAQ